MFIRASVRDEHLAEDVLQEVASVVAAKFDQYNRDLPFEGWAIGISKRVMKQHFRSAKRNGVIFDEEALEALGAAYERREPPRQDRLRALELCLGTLDSQKRALLEMRYQGEVEVQEIATRLGATANAISCALHRIRTDLAACVKRRLAMDKRSGL
ncbi:sigma-70 family RNA polymerase sigma factor [Aeoliella sp. ICT_H6.2]|uniref:Sigma-70 family RNA polymerase sigma factor n=1 Tax=Aeoliella straminimaris TaxID=2954799 RepID=A0A9X2F9Z7_9BACT|nr:sigma-70 family RNA polymerase sigma factor [Aeoliella straminimaris]